MIAGNLLAISLTNFPTNTFLHTAVDRGKVLPNESRLAMKEARWTLSTEAGFSTFW